MPASRWDNFVWPRWLPETARLPLIAQVTGAVALTALIMGPWWSRVPSSPLAATVLPPTHFAPLQPAIAPTRPVAPPPASRPAHLNLDVRHSFASVDLSVSVDGKRALETKLEGSGKKFGIVGKRAERGFTHSLELEPGVRVVRIRVRSDQDRFDQTRTERFDLGSASVASMRIAAERSGLDVVAQHPPPPAPTTEPASPAAPPVATSPAAAPSATPGVALTAAQQANAIAELLQSLRSMLIAIAGFVASAATGFVVQEYLRSRKGMIFVGEENAEAVDTRRRRKRRGQAAIDAP